MQIAPLGDSALVVRIRETFDDDSDEVSRAVLGALRQLEAAAIPGIVELAPAYTTVALFFDPLRVIDAGAPPTGIVPWLESRIREAFDRPPAKTARSKADRIVEIPVCYDREFALDLEDVARHANRSIDQVINLHSSGQYRVQCVGFTPGFPFLSGLPSELATPRRASPRTKVPSGSVGIGGAQTGVYPLPSPGGWNVIGRTPLRLFDVSRDSPALLHAGDRVRFRAISRGEFDDLTR
jgi:inhibitor of KinA